MSAEEDIFSVIDRGVGDNYYEGLRTCSERGVAVACSSRMGIKRGCMACGGDFRVSGILMKVLIKGEGKCV